MKKLILGLFLLSGVAHACDKIEYVEDKDWPVAKVERALYDATAEALQGARLGIELTDISTGRSPYDDTIHLCDAQARLYIRVLENVHKRTLPPLEKLSVSEACKSFPGAHEFTPKAKP